VLGQLLQAKRPEDPVGEEVLDERVQRVPRRGRSTSARPGLIFPLAWARERYHDVAALRGYLEQDDMTDLPDDLSGFLVFWDVENVCALG
jgi:hypothetical protein